MLLALALNLWDAAEAPDTPSLVVDGHDAARWPTSRMTPHRRRLKRLAQMAESARQRRAMESDGIRDTVGKVMRGEPLEPRPVRAVVTPPVPAPVLRTPDTGLAAAMAAQAPQVDMQAVQRQAQVARQWAARDQLQGLLKAVRSV